MEPPKNKELPFFSYGIFKPGELGYLSIHDLVYQAERTHIKGNLMIRDGLPLAFLDGDWEIQGYLLRFKKDNCAEAYQKIVDIEPKYQYRWDTIKVGENSKEANILAGKQPKRGSTYSDETFFNGKQDPLFNEGFELIEETISNHDYGFKEFFKLQSSYLLLWSIIERYVTIRYNIGSPKINLKIMFLSQDEYFCKQLKSTVKRVDKIFSTHEPDDKINLDSDNPRNCINYYYQMRSNITHRGKASHQDCDRLHQSISELNKIMKNTIDNAFNESESYIDS